jgi:regulator of replication initiation timing
MSAIKEVIDLVISRSNRVQDRQTSAEISKIQSLILSVQSENASLVSENLELKKKLVHLEISHAQEKAKLTNEITDLRKKQAGKDDDDGFASDVIISSHFKR